VGASRKTSNSSETNSAGDRSLPSVLEAELRIVKPKLVVAMGATAAQTIFGPSFRVTRERGKVLSSKLAPRVLATVHPSSLLRQPDEASREREYKLFVTDFAPRLRAAGEE